MQRSVRLSVGKSQHSHFIRRHSHSSNSSVFKCGAWSAGVDMGVLTGAGGGPDGFAAELLE